VCFFKLKYRFFRIEYRNEEKMQEITILMEIQEAIRLCLEAGREPIALLINPKVLDTLSQKLENYLPGNASLNRIAGLNKIFGLTVFEHPSVKDFYLVDDRSWAEQKW